MRMLCVIYVNVRHLGGVYFHYGILTLLYMFSQAEIFCACFHGRHSEVQVHVRAVHRRAVPVPPERTSERAR